MRRVGVVGSVQLLVGLAVFVGACLLYLSTLDYVDNMTLHSLLQMADLRRKVENLTRELDNHLVEEKKMRATFDEMMRSRPDWSQTVRLDAVTESDDPLCNVADVSPDPTIFEAHSLPQNPKCMPTIGNGYLATVVYSDTIYMNGLYNGQGSQSHRARIPSTADVRVSVDQGTVNHTYTLNLQEGAFIHRITEESGQFVIEQQVYAHRYYTRVMVNQVTATRSANFSQDLDLTLTTKFTPTSDDIDFTQPVTNTNIRGVRQLSGTIKVAETSSSGRPRVYVMWVEVPPTVTLPAKNASQTWIFYTAISNTAEDAQAFIDICQQAEAIQPLYNIHTAAWRYTWSRGQIQVEGSNLGLAKAVQGSLYYLLSSLPPLMTDPSFHYPFGGLSPGGLAHGSAQDHSYQGHVFWDMETWMYPTVLLLHPFLAWEMLDYRLQHLAAAKQNAATNGHKGAQFPWESAYSGCEVDPDEHTRRYEQHVTGDLALALRQYLLLTAGGALDGRGGVKGSRLQSQVVMDAVMGIAEFWAGRAQFSTELQAYVINGVMPPDEYHYDVNNSAYTNAVAAIGLRLPQLAAQYYNATVPPQWQQIADQLYMPFDPKLNYHPEYDGYTPGTVIKQADVVLLGYPLMVNMSWAVRLNDLQAYSGDVISPSGPAMSWAMYAIGWLELDNHSMADPLFNRSYRNLRQPFKIWTEEADGGGAVNFITGMGGFLQAVLFGYGGFRLRADRLDFDPRMPPESSGLKVQGLDYLGTALDFSMSEKQVNITATLRSEGAPLLQVVCGGKTQAIVAGGSTVELPRKPGYIQDISKGKKPSSLNNNKLLFKKHER